MASTCVALGAASAPRLLPRLGEGKPDEPRTDAVVPVTASARAGRAMSWLAMTA
jgi:hypothetical protein